MITKVTRILQLAKIIEGLEKTLSAKHSELESLCQSEMGVVKHKRMSLKGRRNISKGLRESWKRRQKLKVHA